MPSTVNVTVHSSLYPQGVQRELLQALRTRNIHPKFHYTSYKQSQKWLALHEAYSPSRTDPDCASIYEKCFRAVAAANSSPVHVLGLGCGGGQKEARLLTELKGQGREVFYTPCDISLPLVLTATFAAQSAVPRIKSHPLLCDLTAATDLTEVLERPENRGMARMVTFFGMVPNLEPEIFLPVLRGLIGRGDQLLLSANLAPGPDYAAGVQRVLPGYDNDLTRDWLLTFLLDLGVEQGDGTVSFSIEDSPGATKQIVANFRFARPRRLEVHGERFEFRAGDPIRLFFSYRYTPARLRALLDGCKLSVSDQWIAASGEEGVFLCQT